VNARSLQTAVGFSIFVKKPTPVGFATPLWGEQPSRTTIELEPVMMKSYLSVASLLALVVTTTLTVPAVARDAYAGAARDAHTTAAVGREVPAPPWSAACMTDHGPSECGEPMWVYGSPARGAR
jgi:hypothetical protein